MLTVIAFTAGSACSAAKRRRRQLTQRPFGRQPNRFDGHELVVVFGAQLRDVVAHHVNDRARRQRAIEAAADPER